MAYTNPSDFVVSNFFKNPNEIDRETLEFLDSIGEDIEETREYYNRVFQLDDEKFFD